VAGSLSTCTMHPPRPLHHRISCPRRRI
jgi:hypothetical protein